MAARPRPDATSSTGPMSTASTAEDQDLVHGGGVGDAVQEHDDGQIEAVAYCGPCPEFLAGREQIAVPGDMATAFSSAVPPAAVAAAGVPLPTAPPTGVELAVAPIPVKGD